MATLETMAVLAATSSAGFGVGYIAGSAATGADATEILQMFGDWGAGFAEGVSGGFLTDVYEVSTGEKVEPDHALLWRAGTIAGISVSFLIGMRAVQWAATGIGPLQWVAMADGFLDVYGAGKATYDLGQSYAENGAFEREDAWNLLSYVPFAGAVLGGVKKFFSANKAIKGGAKSKNNLLKKTGKTGTSIGGQCFVAGTKVLTPDGEKNIEDIQVGDWVIADDPTTPGGVAPKQVMNTFVRQTEALVDLYVDGEVISTTGEHPFWVPDKGWVEAQDLQVGDLLQTDEETFVDIDRIERREGDFEVYNFDVEGFSTYFVSDLGILVHNADCGDVAKLYQDELGGGKRIRVSSKEGGFLQDPKDSGWFMHEVFVKEEIVYDPMGMGDLGGIDISSRGSLNFRDFDQFDPNPTELSEWLEAYGGGDRLNIEEVFD